MIEINNNKYELIKNYKEAYDEEEFLSKCTDYFYSKYGTSGLPNISQKKYNYLKNNKIIKIESLFSKLDEAKEKACYESLDKYYKKRCERAEKEG